MAKKIEKDETKVSKPKKSNGNGDKIDWLAVEKEFRQLHADRDYGERMLELKKLALEHDRELVVYGLTAYLVEYEYQDPTNPETTAGMS